MENIKIVVVSEETALRVSVKKKIVDKNILIVGYADFNEDSKLKIEGLFPDMVVIAAKVPIQKSIFDFIESMKFQSKGCSVVLATDQVSVDLVNFAARYGIRQVLSLDSSDEEFCRVITEVNEFEKKIQSQLNIQKRVRSKVIAFFGCKGGVGKSMLAANTAVALAKRGAKVMLLDFDLAFGEQHLLLDLDPKDTIVELAQDPEGISIERVNAFSTLHSSGVSLLACPKSPEYAEYVSAENITAIIRSVRPYYEYIIIDAANNFSDESIAALENCDEIMIVSNPDILSLKAAKNAINILGQLQIKEKARILINKDATPTLIKPKDFEQMLEMPIYASFSFDYKTVNGSINKGEPFILRSSRAVICREVNAFVQKIIADKKD
jgi:pilus assembly protein CpaE